MNAYPESSMKSVFAVLAAGLACGAAVGIVSRIAGWDRPEVSLIVGLTVGMVGAMSRWPANGGKLSAMAISLAMGLVATNLIAVKPVWRAQASIAANQIDELCVRVTAMRMCQERNIMGVFDFSDVPARIKNEAGERVALMSQSEKYLICDETFGNRINSAGGEKSFWDKPLPRHCLWGGLSAICAALPLGLRKRESTREAPAAMRERRMVI